jgi:hypothetical protein
MNYTVTWRPSAEQQLAQLWLSASDRDAVRAAADHMDAVLQRDPLSEGEARAGNTRIFIAPPLAGYYDVHPPPREVFVWAVWRTRNP